MSNHGGRQLDGVAPTLRVLPEVVEAAGSRVEVLLDGGIRRGGDIAKALCLGARAVLVGRAYAYGLGAAGGARRRARDRDPARRPHPDAQAARLRLGHRAGPLVREPAGGLALTGTELAPCTPREQIMAHRSTKSRVRRPT